MTMTPEAIFDHEFHGECNFLTPVIIRFYALPDGAVELSRGESLFRKDCFGVTVIRVNVDGATRLDVDASTCFFDRVEAEQYIESLGGR